MDTHKLASLIASIHDTLKIIETSLELSQQTTRFRNIVQRAEFDEVVASAATCLRYFGSELKKELQGGNG